MGFLPFLFFFFLSEHNSVSFRVEREERLGWVWSSLLWWRWELLFGGVEAGDGGVNGGGGGLLLQWLVMTVTKNLAVVSGGVVVVSDNGGPCDCERMWLRVQVGPPNPQWVGFGHVKIGLRRVWTRKCQPDQKLVWTVPKPSWIKALFC